jgi:hypothetical protein
MQRGCAANRRPDRVLGTRHLDQAAHQVAP